MLGDERGKDSRSFLTGRRRLWSTKPLNNACRNALRLEIPAIGKAHKVEFGFGPRQIPPLVFRTQLQVTLAVTKKGLTLPLKATHTGGRGQTFSEFPERFAAGSDPLTLPGRE
jgi:hypothetical protein